MDGGSSRSEDEFITSLPFIRAWPLSMADDQPEMFRYHFYKLAHCSLCHFARLELDAQYGRNVCCFQAE